jgi:RimJ/RimL family protein N-acetyltransferase
MTTARPPIPLPDPPLGEGDLRLRPWAMEDARALAEAWADPEVERWTGVPERADQAAAARWISGEADRRARGLALDLVIEQDGQVVGEVGLSDLTTQPGAAEIGWWVAPDRRGRGLAARAARLVAMWAVEELCVDEVVARCRRTNPVSSGVARAAGFRRADQTAEEEVWRFG